MNAPYDLVAYAYKADLYCPDCVLSEVNRDAEKYPDLSMESLAKELGIDQEDETSYDSDEFPKVVFRDQIESYEDHCCKCHELL